ncbi:TrkH family potassium uptake protein [Aminipila sp.]|uniref:TrkH family potassium uptake protein n=1 Tax=Aminipila sp. TaxID=2060095 RepID=UPI0028A05F6F|nr:TrkH family potassium uptake protein [Aminipila sp.]
MLYKMEKLFTPIQIIAYGFLAAILIGAALLTLPVSAKQGQTTEYMDALFTATSAICVTGLTTVTTAEHWSLFGQIVILGLIQFGGLGVITVTTSILLLLHKRITLTERILIQDAYNLNTLGGLVKLTLRVLKGTFLIEGIGAALFAFQFIPEFGFSSGLWKAVFHSISAFCNAGIDLIGQNSFVPYADSLLMNLTTMALIVIGGIGFPVWWDIIRVLNKLIEEKLSPRFLFKKLELHSKVAITATLFLIISGTIMVFCLEYTNDLTIGTMPLGEKILASLFQSVTTRTAGFFTISQDGLRESSAFVCILLMFIGGSPSGTAGGIKTVTAVILLISTVAVIKGKPDAEIFYRKINDGYCRKALAVSCFSLLVLIVSTLCLSIVQNAEFLNILYETTSAIGTVGLTRNLTPSLTELGKLVVIITMYLGRIGPITLALVLNPQKSKGKVCTLPEEQVLIG